MEDGGIESEAIVRRPHELVFDDNNERDKDRDMKKLKLDNDDGGGSGSGILENLLSKISSSPRAPSTPKPPPFDSTADGDGGVDNSGGGGGGGGGGGVLSNLISSFFHQDNDNGNDNINKEGGDQLVEDGKREQRSEVAYKTEEGGAANLISSLVPDELAPAPDEASILIHSVVHD